MRRSEALVMVWLSVASGAVAASSRFLVASITYTPTRTSTPTLSPTPSIHTQTSIPILHSHTVHKSSLTPGTHSITSTNTPLTHPRTSRTTAPTSSPTPCNHVHVTHTTSRNHTYTSNTTPTSTSTPTSPHTPTSTSSPTPTSSLTLTPTTRTRRALFLTYKGEEFRFPRSPKSQTFSKRGSKKAESSSVLSRHSVDGLVDVLQGAERWDVDLRSDEAGQRAVLTWDLYQGKQMLVYKLAPGPVFRGVRTQHSSSVGRDSGSSAQQNTKFNTVSNKDMDKYNSVRKYIGSNIKPGNGMCENSLDRNCGTTQQNRHTGLSKKHLTTYKSVRKYGGSDIQPGYGVSEGREALQKESRGEWAVHYVQPPPPLSAMHNPYLARVRQGGVHRRRKGGGVYVKVRPSGGDLAWRGLAHGVRKLRSKVRGAWVSFLLLHYLGFLPPLPGIPRHKDPATLTHSETNALPPPSPHYLLPSAV